MTSEEMKETRATDLSTNGWLREVCLQLVRMNECHLGSEVKPAAPEPERVKRAYNRKVA